MQYLCHSLKKEISEKSPERKSNIFSVITDHYLRESACRADKGRDHGQTTVRDASWPAWTRGWRSVPPRRLRVKADGHTEREIEGETGRKIDRQIDGQVDIHT